MISNYSKSAYFLMVGLLVAVLLVAGCSPAAPKPAPTAESNAAAAEPAQPQSQAAKENTAQSAPASTKAVAVEAASTEPATATAAPAEANATGGAAIPAGDATATTAPKGQLPQGLSAWCLPEDAAISKANDPLKPPANAKKAKLVKDALEIRNLPSNGCVFLFTFDQPAQEGLKLEVYEVNQPKPFLTADFQPAVSKAETVWAFVRHAMIIAPPTDNISYSFVVRDSQGKELHTDKVSLYRWVPGTPQPKEKDEDCGCSFTPPKK